MQSEGPLTSDPVLLTDLAKGDLFFIRIDGEPEAQLAILVSDPTADPIRIMYSAYHYRWPTYFYQSEVAYLQTFRVYPPNYINPAFEKIREQLFPRRLGKPIDEHEVIQRGLGKLYYFKEDNDRYVLGKLEYMRISQHGEIDILYREMPSEDFPEGQPHRRHYSPGSLTPYIWIYREPPPSRLNILKQGNAIMARNGPEGGMETIRHHMGKAAIHEREPILMFRKKTQNARLKAESEAAAGGGGGMADNANNNNTAKGGRRKHRKPRRRTRRA